MPAAAPAVSPGPDGRLGTPDDVAFFPRATAADGAFGVGFQVGLIYNVNDLISFGVAYTSKQDFEDFEFNSVWENPLIRFGPQAFGTPRTITFALDVPPVLGFGVKLQALPNLLLAADYRRIYYAGTDGFKLADPDHPFNPDGSVAGFGWKDISVWAVGAQFKVSDNLALRAGYNHSDNPIPDKLSMLNIPAPAIMKDHYTFGAGFKVSRKAAINLGYYHVKRTSVSGPILSPFGPVPGTDVTSSMDEDSILMSFSFTTRGEIF